MTGETLREQLQRIHDRHGRLDPVDVVTEAANTAHPLHRFFEWDDGAAAHAHRVEQARGLIRRVRIEVHADTDTPPIRVRGFVSVDPDGEERSRAYRPLAAVADDEQLRARVMDEARRDLDRLRHKYRALGAAFTALLREHANQQDAA